MERRLLQRELSFSHNGETIIALLIEDPPAGGRWAWEFCSVCNQTLGNRSFYITNPPRFYIHGHCAAASLPNPTSFHSRPPSAQQSRRIPQNFFPSSAPPTNLNSYPPPPYYNHPYYNQFHPPPYYNHPYYNQFHPPPPPTAAAAASSSVPIWAGLASSAVGAFLNALFSSVVFDN